MRVHLDPVIAGSHSKRQHPAEPFSVRPGGGEVFDQFGNKLAPSVALTLPGGRYRMTSRIVAEAILGRVLAGDEVVGHLNGDDTDNRGLNLDVRVDQPHPFRGAAQGGAAWLN